MFSTQLLAAARLFSRNICGGRRKAAGNLKSLPEVLGGREGGIEKEKKRNEAKELFIWTLFWRRVEKYVEDFWRRYEGILEELWGSSCGVGVLWRRSTGVVEEVWSSCVVEDLWRCVVEEVHMRC